MRAQRIFLDQRECEPGWQSAHEDIAKDMAAEIVVAIDAEKGKLSEESAQ